MKKDILKNKIIFKKYKTISRIGKGSFGYVYSAKNINDNTKVAVKFEEKTCKNHLLEKESNFLSILKGIGIPQIFSYGYNNNYYILIQELLGENLFQLMNTTKSFHLNIKDISMIAIQVIDRIEYVHSKGVIHRDMKPENFLLGLENKTFLYLIDFGIARKYRSSRTGKHIKYSLTGKLFGTMKFLSYNATRGVEQSRRDDLESIGYMLVFLSGNKLPWEGYSIRGPRAKTNYNKILHLKKISKPEIYCKYLPLEFAEYISYCRKLNFEQDPDYDYIRNLFINVLRKMETINDLNFSWLNKFSFTNIFKIKTNKNDDKKSLSREKYVNFQKRKTTPQIRLLSAIQKSLSNDFSKDKQIVPKKSLDNENNNYIKHIKGKSFDSNNIINSFYSNLSKDELTNDSIKVRYNVCIDEIGNEIKKEKNAIIKNNNKLNFLKNNNMINNNKENFKFYNVIDQILLKPKKQKYISKNKNIRKKFNLSIDLDKKFLMDKNSLNNNYKKKKRYSLSPKIKKNEKNNQKTEEEKRRSSLCTKIYENILKKFSLKTKQINTKKINRKIYYIIPKSNNKILNSKKYNNLLYINNINNKPFANEEKKHFKMLSNIINDNLQNENNITTNIKDNKITNIVHKQLWKNKISKRKYINNININDRTSSGNSSMKNQNFENRKIIIINNNINGLNNNHNSKDFNGSNEYTYKNCHTPQRYITIKERKALNRVHNTKNEYSLPNHYISPIIYSSPNIFNYDNYAKKPTNLEFNTIMKMNSRNKDVIFNKHKRTSGKSFNSVNYIKKTNYINLPNNIPFNKSNDAINKRVQKEKIKIYNYKSVINKIDLVNNKGIFSGKINATFNKIYLNPVLRPLTRKNIKLMKLKQNILTMKQKQTNPLNFNKNNNVLLNNNNNANSNMFISNQYLQSINKNDYRYLNHNQKLSLDISANNYYKLYPTNNRLYESKSNVNLLEEMIKKRRAKQLYDYHTNSVEPIIISYTTNRMNYMNEAKQGNKYNNFNYNLYK